MLKYGKSHAMKNNDGKNLIDIALEADREAYLQWYFIYYNVKKLCVEQDMLSGHTPLHTAIQLKKPLSICAILASRPLLAIIDKRGRTVFDMAKEVNDEPLIELLQACDIIFKQEILNRSVKEVHNDAMFI